MLPDDSRLSNGGTLEHVRQTAVHEMLRAAKLLRRAKQRLTRDAWNDREFRTP